MPQKKSSQPRAEESAARPAGKKSPSKRKSTKAASTETARPRKVAAKKGVQTKTRTRVATREPVAAKTTREGARRTGGANKVSPLRGMPIEAWIAAKTSGWQSEVARRVVDAVRRAAPK